MSPRRNAKIPYTYVLSEKSDHLYVLMPLDWREHPKSFAEAYSFPKRSPSSGRLPEDALDHVDENSLRGIFMGDIVVLQQNRIFWIKYHARLSCAECGSSVGLPCTFVDLAWKIAVELDNERTNGRIMAWAGRPEDRHYDDPGFIEST